MPDIPPYLKWFPISKFADFDVLLYNRKIYNSDFIEEEFVHCELPSASCCFERWQLVVETLVETICIAVLMMKKGL